MFTYLTIGLSIFVIVVVLNALYGLIELVRYSRAYLMRESEHETTYFEPLIENVPVISDFIDEHSSVGAVLLSLFVGLLSMFLWPITLIVISWITIVQVLWFRKEKKKRIRNE